MADQKRQAPSLPHEIGLLARCRVTLDPGARQCLQALRLVNKNLTPAATEVLLRRINIKSGGPSGWLQELVDSGNIAPLVKEIVVHCEWQLNEPDPNWDHAVFSDLQAAVHKAINVTKVVLDASGHYETWSQVTNQGGRRATYLTSWASHVGRFTAWLPNISRISKHAPSAAYPLVERLSTYTLPREIELFITPGGSGFTLPDILTKAEQTSKVESLTVNEKDGRKYRACIDDWGALSLPSLRSISLRGIIFTPQNNLSGFFDRCRPSLQRAELRLVETADIAPYKSILLCGSLTTLRLEGVKLFELGMELLSVNMPCWRELELSYTTIEPDLLFRIVSTAKGTLVDVHLERVILSTGIGQSTPPDTIKKTKSAQWISIVDCLMESPKLKHLFVDELENEVVLQDKRQLRQLMINLRRKENPAKSRIDLVELPGWKDDVIAPGHPDVYHKLGELARMMQKRAGSALGWDMRARSAQPNASSFSSPASPERCALAIFAYHFASLPSLEDVQSGNGKRDDWYPDNFKRWSDTEE